MALGQTDTTKICFTKSQVKTFLKTKVELLGCHQTNQILQIDISTANEKIIDLGAYIEKKNKRLKRTRIIAVGGIAGSILFALITFIK